MIATQWGHEFRCCFQREPRFRGPDLVRQLEGSLRALRTDYVDVLQFHSGGDDQSADEERWEAARAAQRAGKVRFLGDSIGSNSNVAQNDASKRAGVGVIQVAYNRLQREPESGVFQSCARQNLGVLARVPLASGFLSGRYTPGHTFPADDVREVWMKHGRDGNLAEVQRIAAEEGPPGKPMARWALEWVLRNPVVTAVIPGCRDAAQVRANARTGT